MFGTRRVEALDAYRGRLVIDWGAGQRAWVQRADLQDKPIVELRRAITEPEFPGTLHVVLRHDAFPDVSAWGVALVDLARHIANAHQQVSGSDPVEVLNRIRSVFDAEWRKPTDEARGSLVE